MSYVTSLTGGRLLEARFSWDGCGPLAVAPLLWLAGLLKVWYKRGEESVSEESTAKDGDFPGVPPERLQCLP